MSCRGLIAAVTTVAAILSGDAGAGLASDQSRQEPDLAAYNLGVAAPVRSDLTASVRLPDGGQVYVRTDGPMCVTASRSRRRARAVLPASGWRSRA